MKNIILIRHGESEDNLKKVIQSQESPLTPKGKLQAKKTLEELKGYNIVEIITSSTKRAFQTAEIISQGFSNLPIKTEKGFDSINLQKVIGIPLIEIPPLSPIEFAEKNNTGENREKFFNRVKKAWKETRVRAQSLKQNEFLVVVAHRSVFSMIEAIENNLSFDEGVALRKKNYNKSHGFWGIA